MSGTTEHAGNGQHPEARAAQDSTPSFDVKDAGGGSTYHPYDPHDDDPDIRMLARATPSRIAHFIGQVFDPTIVISGLLFAACLAGTQTLWQALGWWLVSLAVVMVLPVLILLLLVRVGLVSEWQIPKRRERLLPFAISLVVIGGALVALDALGAPSALWEVVVAMLAGSVVMMLITSVYKASMHCAVLSGTAGILVVLFGVKTLWFTVPIIAIVGWSRVRGGRHTLGQVLVGSIVGGLVTMSVMLLLQM